MRVRILPGVQIGFLAQLVEHWFEAPCVAGSIPAETTNTPLAQLVEHWSPKPGVESSNLSGCANLETIWVSLSVPNQNDKNEDTTASIPSR